MYVLILLPICVLSFSPTINKQLVDQDLRLSLAVQWRMRIKLAAVTRWYIDLKFNVTHSYSFYFL